MTEVQQQQSGTGKQRAVVVGATGAVGRHIVGQLLVSDKWSKVTTISRRAVEVPEEYPKEKWQLQPTTVLVSSLDNLETEAKPAFEDADVVFCALGTRRKEAGSAENFIKVDLDYVAASARAAKAGGARLFSLVSSKGASTRYPADKWRIMHPFLYLNTKGKAEDAVKQQGFPRVSIFRPGVLDRGAATTGWAQKLSGALMGGIPVAQVARAMLLDAERSPQAQGVAIFENPAIQKAAEQNAAPV